MVETKLTQTMEYLDFGRMTMARSMKTVWFLLMCSALLSAQTNNLTRDEVSVVKKKLVAVIDALGQPPKGYVKEDEDFSLPTEFSKNATSGLYYPVYGSVQMKFGGGAEKIQKKTEKEFQQDYQKKIAEAQAKGDYEAVAKLAQEMQKKMGEAQVKVIEATKEPINVSITFNSNPGQTIDPDGVVFEKPGVLALKFKENEAQEKIRVVVYFDPVSLKDTKQLSKVDLAMPDEGIKSKTGVLNATIEFTGPSAEVEQWAKTVSANKVLAQIDRK